MKLAKTKILKVVDGCTGPTDTATIQLSGSLLINASARYDIGIFIAEDGGDAKTGSCFREYLPPPLVSSPTLANLQSGYGPYWNGGADSPDKCGDGQQNSLTTLINRIFSTSTSDQTPQNITIKCRDSDNDGLVDFDYCTAWRNNAKPECGGILDSGIAQNAAKCKCDKINTDLRVPNPLAPPVLEIVKTVMPSSGTCGVDDKPSLSLQTRRLRQHQREVLLRGEEHERYGRLRSLDRRRQRDPGRAG